MVTNCPECRCESSWNLGLLPGPRAFPPGPLPPHYPPLAAYLFSVYLLSTSSLLLGCKSLLNCRGMHEVRTAGRLCRSKVDTAASSMQTRPLLVRQVIAAVSSSHTRTRAHPSTPHTEHLWSVGPWRQTSRCIPKKCEWSLKFPFYSIMYRKRNSIVKAPSPCPHTVGPPLMGAHLSQEHKDGRKSTQCQRVPQPPRGQQGERLGHLPRGGPGLD